MPTNALHGTYKQLATTVQSAPTLFKVGAVATASAILASLATAWYYRDTVKKLQNLEKAQTIHKSESSNDPLDVDE